MSEAIEILTSEERSLVTKTPETGFIPDFIEWAGLKTDAPSYTLKAAAFQALSLACGDNVVLPGLFSDAPTYLNLFIIVVGPSTTMRKSTVLNYVRGLLPKNQQTQKDYIHFLDDVSTQAFNKAMAELGRQEAPLMFSVDEIAGLFEVVRRKNSFLSGFDKVLMKAYDHSPVMIHRTNSRIEVETGCFVNVFAASTPEPLLEVLNSDDIESGLLPRFIIFDAREAERTKRISLMERKKHDERWLEQREELREFLYQVAKNRADGFPNFTDLDEGASTYPRTFIPYTDEATVRLDAIDQMVTEQAHGGEGTGWSAIKGRAFWHVVKLAGLFAVSRAGLKAEVELIDVLRASALVEDTVSDLAKMAQQVGSNQLERNMLHVMELINSTNKRRMSQGVIAQRLSLSHRDLQEVYRTLRSRELINKAITDQAGKTFWEGA